MRRQYGSMKYQVHETLINQLKIGESKHNAKMMEGRKAPEGIFSYGTFETYRKQGIIFAKWAKETHQCKSLDVAKEYIVEFLQNGVNERLSPSTLCTQRAAICKIYGIGASDIDIMLPERNRSDIKRSRGAVTRDKHFSLTKNADIINFCSATGLRRHELAALRQNQIHISPNGTVKLCGVKGKGGKIRTVAVVPGMEASVAKYANPSSTRRVFPKIPSNMDVHGYRREYATSMYKAYQEHLRKTEGRDFRTLPESSLYRCRKDKAGVVYDKKVMAYVSRQLGHNRISIIAGHYIDKIEE